jgi:hypothetical protein
MLCCQVRDVAFQLIRLSLNMAFIKHPHTVQQQSSTSANRCTIAQQPPGLTGRHATPIPEDAAACKS